MVSRGLEGFPSKQVLPRMADSDDDDALAYPDDDEDLTDSDAELREKHETEMSDKRLRTVTTAALRKTPLENQSQDFGDTF